jgi:hypothetical protein
MEQTAAVSLVWDVAGRSRAGEQAPFAADLSADFRRGTAGLCLFSQRRTKSPTPPFCYTPLGRNTFTVPCTVQRQTSSVCINVTWRFICVTTVAVQKQDILHILSLSRVCVCGGGPVLSSIQSACAVLSYIAFLAVLYFYTFCLKRHDFI